MAVSIIGSLNMDFITRTSRLPQGGETLAAKSHETGFGGKGANQAVAAARLAPPEVQVKMIGQVGEDTFGREYFDALRGEGIQTDGVRMLKGRKTGVTNIIVEEETGENRILFVANANEEFTEEYEKGSWDLVEEGKDEEKEVVVFQLEIPMRVVLHNLQKAHLAGHHTILNPAPATPLPSSAYPHISTLVMNESETAILLGPSNQPPNQSPQTLISVAKKFLSWGVRDAVIITLGGSGLVYATASGEEGHVPANKAKVIDTTAAGDTFVGAYAVRRSQENFTYSSALQFATKAASKTVEKEGAMAAIPHLHEIQ